MTYYYLATPYSRYPGGHEAAFRLACEQAAVLVLAGVPVYSPIAHTHPIAVYGGIDPSHAFPWLEVDRPMMRAARGCIMLRAETWQESAGMAAERDAFVGMGKPVFYMDPGIVPAVLSAGEKQRAYQARRAAWTAGVERLT